MDKIDLKLCDTSNSLTEIFQTNKVQIAHVNSDYEQVHQPGKCRDFLGDMMWSRYNKKVVYIYGLEYDFVANPYDTETLRLSLKFANKDQYANFIKNISFLHEKEKRANVNLTTVYDTQHDKTVVVEADNAWQQCVWKLSLYTFYLKLMTYPDVTKPASPEVDYLEQLTEDREVHMLNHITDDFNPIEEHLDNNHNASGFYSALHVFKVRNEPNRIGYIPASSVRFQVAKHVFGEIW